MPSIEPGVEGMMPKMKKDAGEETRGIRKGGGGGGKRRGHREAEERKTEAAGEHILERPLTRAFRLLFRMRTDA